MKKSEMEKTLKRYLKRKIRYSFSFLIAFLITGTFSFASELSRKELLLRIKIEREKLEEMLRENERSLNKLRKENIKLVKEADFYVKPEKATGVSFLAEYRDSHSVEKEWKGSRRENTSMDGKRGLFNSELSFQTSENLTENEKTLLEATKYTNTVDKRSSGWLNMSPSYSKNTNIYDAEARVFILPVVNPPTVKTPVVPTVSFTTPTAPAELRISEPSLINIAVGAINVNTPVVTVPTVNIPASPTTPATPLVAVNEPNMSIAIGAINVGTPAALTVPSLTAPIVNVNVSPNVPPSIVPPNPTVVPPDSPEAPNFGVYVRKRGNWLRGVSGVDSDDNDNNSGFNNFDRRIDRWVGVNNTNTSINNAPFFSLNGTISGKDGKRDSQVIAISEWNSDGTLKKITNKYTDIKHDTATKDLHPTNAWFNPASLSKSETPFQGVDANTLTSNEDNASQGNADSKKTDNLIANKRQQNWIFQGAPTLVKDMTITVGGLGYDKKIPYKDSTDKVIGTYAPNQGTAIFAQTRGVRMKNVQINLQGHTTVADIDSQGNYEAKFENVDIDIKNEYNTIFSLSSVTTNRHRYHNSDNLAPHATDSSPPSLYADFGWGAYEGDTATDNNGINLGTTNLKARTSNNAIFYLLAAATHRWNGDKTQTHTIPAGLTSQGNNGKTYIVNPGAYTTYYPSPGNIKFENAGNIEFTGSGNAAAWLRSFVPNRTELLRYDSSSGNLVTISGATKPIVNLGNIKLYGDKNVAYYFANHNTRPNENAIFQGDLKVNVEMGTKLSDSGTGTQQGTGNISGGSNTKSEKNVAVFVASGQRPEMNTKSAGTDNFKHYYPATLSHKLTETDINQYGTGLLKKIHGIDPTKQDPSRNDIGAWQLGTNADIKAKITNFNLSDFTTKFGKYSKDSIGLVAKNGTVVDLGGSSLISDNAEPGAEQNIMVYAEGVWFNPRKALTQSTLDREAYARGESPTGQKYISDFNTTVNLKNNMEMKSIKSTALFAKSGAKIDSTNNDVTMTGHSSKAVLAHGTYKYESQKIVNSDNTAAGTQPDTTIIVKNITATADGTVADEKNANIAAAAISQDNSGKGSANVSVTVKEKVDVHGVAAFARGEKATVTIEGKDSTITSGKNAGLVAKDGGTVNFGGGTMKHDTENAVAFFSEKTNSLTSKLNFKGTTTLDISKGIVFFGDKEDYSKTNTPASGETGRYTGMENLTVNLTGNGVNLGVFKDVNATWDGTDTYVDGLKVIPKVAGIVTKGHWYKSALEKGTLTVKTDVNRDHISSGATVGDRFNDITMERTKVILTDAKKITSSSGKGLAMASNFSANSNTESGYTVENGAIKIANGSNPTTAAYVDFGHIEVKNAGGLEVTRGVAAYGVNGSTIKNEGTIKATDGTASQNIGIVALAQKQGINPPTTTQDDYGKVANKGSGNKWVEVINKGNIEVAGKDAIGIYLKNNYDGITTPGTVTTPVPKSEMLITNEGKISVGEAGKAIVMQSTHKTGGTLILKDSGTKQDIKVGKNGIGVYTEHSDIKFDGNYGMAIAEDGVAIQMVGDSKISTTGTNDVLTVEYKGAANGTAMALGYEEQLLDGSSTPKTTTSFENNLHIKLENTDAAKVLVGLYASKGTGFTVNDSVSEKLTNKGNIESKYTGSYGILSKGVEIENTGVITVGDITKTTSEAVGIYAENAALTTDGDKIKVLGHGTSTAPTATPIGIYAKATSALETAKTIAINKGTSAMEVTGKNAVGIYLTDESTNNEQLRLKNKSDISLDNSTTPTERRIGILARNAKSATNETNSTIKVKKNNIGIYNDNSILTHSGTLEVKHDENGSENIGAHNIGKHFTFNVKKSGTNSGLLDVEGRNSTIGISALTSSTNKGTINLENAEIKVKASSLEDGKIPLGIYAKGNNIAVNSATGANQTKFTVSPNAVGAYLEGNATTTLKGNYKFNLSSEDTKAKVAVGTFFRGGSFAATDSTQNEKVTIESTATATNTHGAIRPIGLFYGEGSTKNEADIEIASTSKEVIGMYGKNLTTGANTFTNKGKIDVNAKGIGAYFSGTNVANEGEVSITAAEGYGLYLQGGNSYTTANMTAAGKSSIATLVSGTGAKFENKSTTTISATGDKAVGVYVEKEAEFINSGILKSDLAANLPTTSGSIGAFALKGKITNNGNVNSKNVGFYGTDTSTITNTGAINIADGVAILADNETIVNATGRKIEGTANKLSGIIAQNKSTVNLSGTNISLTGNKSIGISLDGSSKATLRSGNVTVGAEGLGLYAKNSSVDLNSYNGTFSMGNKGIAMFADNSSINGGPLNVNYNGVDVGVGIYYKGGTSAVNNTTITYTGSKLVNIFTEGIAFTNKASQTVQTEGIGIYAKGGTVQNEAALTLAGDKTVGIFLDNGAKLNMTSVGNISGGTATNYKVGIYAKEGVIEGNQNYNFGVNNGVALYLDDKGRSTYTGTLNLTAASEAGKRAIGIYTAKSSTPKNIISNINVSKADGIGLFLEGDATKGSTVNYSGTLSIASPSTAAYGIGALLQNKSTFNLTSTGKVKIGGTNNIGFYVQEGGNLQVSGGTVENTADGIFAYLDKGKLHFTKGSTPNITFLNAFVTKAGGEIKNETKILVGTKGLQAAAGAKIENTATGEINASVDKARALVGTGVGTTVQNSGNIKLDGKESVALYITDNAIATSNGSVEVAKNSVAYYAKDNGLINVSGSATIGESSSLFYVDKGKINYTGTDIVLPNKTTALTLTEVPATVNFNNKNITVGEGGVGIYLTKNAEINSGNNPIQNLVKINVNKKASGIFIGNTKNFESAAAIDLIDEEALGVYSTGSGNLTYTGNINSNKLKTKGIVHIGAGNTTNAGMIKLLGDASIGVYAANGGVLTNSGTVEIAKGISGATTVGLYGKNLTEIKNTNKIKMQENAIGIYGENTKVINTGIIENAGKNNNGIYTVESDVENTGKIALGDSSNGIYVDSATGKTITNSGDIKVGGANSTALFAGRNAKIVNKSGTLTTGANSVAIASTAGNISIEAPTNFNVGEKSTYVYSERGTGTNKANISLSDYSIGMYTKQGKMVNKGSITVGKSLVTSTSTDISVAMATEKGEITNDGTILVPEKWGVGMLANGKDGVAGDPRKATNNGTIKVDGELAYGMMAANKSTLINNSIIDVNGKKARGMAATENSTIINSSTGVITVNGEGAQGIYVDGGSKVDNRGIINVNGVARTGIFNGGGTILNKGTINLSGGATATKEHSTNLEVGKIEIKGAKVIFDGVEVINSGAINLPEALDFGTMKIGTTAGNIGTINSKTFGKGEFIVLPNSTLGTNKDVYTIQYLGGFKNIPNNGELSAISHSVSFIAGIQNDVTDPTKPIARIVLARIPYAELTAGTKAIEFGKGLDELYKNLSNKDPKAPEFKIFDALKIISDKDELGSTFDKELRGNIYANVQRRMFEIGDTFTTSYNNLKNNELYAKKRFKAGAIVTGGKSKDKNAGVEDYKSNTLGTIVMYEKDYAKYGRSTNVSLGFTETKFNFDLGSKERVHSLHLGTGYEDLLADNKLKFSTRGQVTISRHNTKRKIHLSNGVFENKGKYWSEMIEWKNMLRYEIPTVGGRMTAGVFGTFDLGCGKFKNISENGDGVELKIKSERIHSVKPGIGADITLRHYTKNGKISLVGTATAEYELGKIYDGANQAKIKNSSAAYYDLEKAKELKDIYKVGAQLQYETNSGHKLGIGVVREEGSIRATRYGVNLMYKF